MKKLILTSVLLAGLSAVSAEKGYDFVTDPNGYSYIQINQDMSSFSFTLYGGASNTANSFSYYTYSEGEENPAQASSSFKGTKTVSGSATLTDLKAGDRIGFIQKDRSHYYAQFTFENAADAYAAVGARGEIKKPGEAVIYFSAYSATGAAGAPDWTKKQKGNIYGNAYWDDWAYIGEIQAVASGSGSGRSDGPASGQPLPGVLAVLALAGGAFGAHRARRVFKRA